MLRKVLLLLFLLLPSFLMADPAPFGLEINRATLADVKAIYSIQEDGIDTYSGGKMVILDPKELPLDGLKSARLVFSKDETLLAMYLNLSAFSLSSTRNSLSAKYQRVGTEYGRGVTTVYTDGATAIKMTVESGRLTMQLDYLSNDYLQTINEEENKQLKSSPL